jgi:hypothetical protein
MQVAQDITAHSRTRVTVDRLRPRLESRLVPLGRVSQRLFGQVSSLHERCRFDRVAQQPLGLDEPRRERQRVAEE